MGFRAFERALTIGHLPKTTHRWGTCSCFLKWPHDMFLSELVLSMSLGGKASIVKSIASPRRFQLCTVSRIENHLLVIFEIVKDAVTQRLFFRLLWALVTIVDHCKNAVLSSAIIPMTVVRVPRRCKWVWVFSLQNTPDWLVILLSVLHHRGSLLPLLLKLLFGPFGFFLFFCHPFFELYIFALESPWRDQLLFKLLGDFLLLRFLLVSDSLFSDLDHLRVIFWVEVLRL